MDWNANAAALTSATRRHSHVMLMSRVSYHAVHVTVAATETMAPEIVWAVSFFAISQPQPLARKTRIVEGLVNDSS